MSDIGGRRKNGAAIRRLLRALGLAGRRQEIPTETSAEDETRFVDYCRVHSAVQVRALSGVLLIGTLIWWPFDPLIFHGQPDVLAALTTWRLATLVAVVGILAAFTWSRAVIARPWTSYTVGAMALSALVGVILCGVSPPRYPFVENAYLLAVPSIAYLGPLGRRSAAAALTLAAWAAATLLAAPAILHAPFLGNTLGLVFFSMVVAIVVGHVFYLLRRQNFLQQLMLDRRARDLEALDQAKSDFFANVSHELRTPLTLIFGSLRALSVEGEDGIRQTASVGLRNAARLLQMINEILDLARLDSGHARMNLRVIDIAALVRRAALDFGGAGGAISCRGADDAVACIGDPYQLRKVLYNLLANAMKFTDPAKRAIEIALGISEHEITITVADNGIGIANDRLEHIFERFVQIDGSATRRYPGTGLGLAIVREVTLKHQGQVTVRSTPGAGSTFTVTLPRGDIAGGITTREADAVDDEMEALVRRLAQSESMAEPVSGQAAAAGSEPASASTARTILVAEDNADLRGYLHRLLSSRFQVRVASNGVEALEKARERRPDLVLTDVMMPLMSGTELLRAVRAEPPLTDVPVVFLTARAGADARSEAFDAGADDSISKPFDERELVARIERILERGRRSVQLEAQNRKLGAELRTMAGGRTAAVEDDRARIARDIHDELGQSLTGMRLELAYLVDHTSEPDKIASGLRRLDGMLDGTFHSARRILLRLRPRLLEEEGLVAATRWLVADFRERTGIDCSLDLRLESDDHAGGEATAIFRTLQESLTNVARHASASHVAVSLEERDGELRAEVRDDGAGFDLEAALARGRGGLLGMRERALEFDGSLTVVSEPGKGTTVTIGLPSGVSRARLGSRSRAGG